MLDQPKRNRFQDFCIRNQAVFSFFNMLINLGQLIALTVTAVYIIQLVNDTNFLIDNITEDYLTLSKYGNNIVGSITNIVNFFDHYLIVNPGNISWSGNGTGNLTK
jgi:hypothetical protein